MAIYATEWTRRETEELIDLWEDIPLLWNASAKDYHNKECRQASIRRIANIFLVPEEDVIRKLKALRTYYAREVAKEADPTRAGVSKDETYRPRWPFYDQLSFLREHITRRARPMPTESVQNCAVSIESGDSTLAPDDDDGDENADDLSQPLAFSRTIKRPTGRFRATAKRARYDNSVPQNEESCTAENGWDETLGLQSGDGAEDIFGRLIACELRHISCERTRELTKIRIQKLIFEARFGEDVCGVPPEQHVPYLSKERADRTRRRVVTGIENNVEHPSVPSRLYPNISQGQPPSLADIVNLEAEPVDAIVVKQELHN